VAAGKSFVISEDGESDWRPRFSRLGIRDHADLLCRPFTARPNMAQWLALVETAAPMRQRRGSHLVVIDSLAYLPAGFTLFNGRKPVPLLAPLPTTESGG
jgi:hypothetical protein